MRNLGEEDAMAALCGECKKAARDHPDEWLVRAGSLKCVGRDDAVSLQEPLLVIIMTIFI
jgi:hypothetical protein